MTEILCRWLNEGLHLDETITQDSFAQDIANGYLLGQLLHQNGLQDDFNSFSKKRTSEAKLNNFMRLESTLHLLDIPFDSQIAHSIMIGEKGAATKLMYQVFVALNKKKSGELTAHSLHANRAPAKVKLEYLQSDHYNQLIKQNLPRQVDLNFQELVDKYHEKQRERDLLIMKQQQSEDEKLALARKEACKKAIKEQRLNRSKQNELYSQLTPLVKDNAPKTAPELRKKSTFNNMNRKLVQDTFAQLDEFETTHLKDSIKRREVSSAGSECNASLTFNREMHASSDPLSDYVAQLKKKSKEETLVRRDREQRKRHVIIEQLKATQELNRQYQKQLLAERLERQCIMEKRVTTQLMQIRKEKDNIRQNRILKQKQYEEERERQFLLAMEKEAIEIKRQQLQNKALLRAKQQKRRWFLQERIKEKYKKNYNLCYDILKQMVDYSTKIGEYNVLTDRDIPAKMIHDWRLLFLHGKPLYEGEEKEVGVAVGCGHMVGGSSSTTNSGEDKRDGDDILDDNDLDEYLQVVNEWSGTDTDLPHPINPILHHVVHRLITEEQESNRVPQSRSEFPYVWIRGSFIGYPFSGKSLSLQYIKDKFDVHILSPSELVNKSVEAYKKREKETKEKEEKENNEEEQEEEKKEEGEGEETVAEEGKVIEEKDVELEKEKEDFERLADFGERAYGFLICGEPVDESIVIDIILHFIMRVPPGSGWLLDNYPATMEQAKLLTEKLSGTDSSTVTTKFSGQKFKFIPSLENEKDLVRLQLACGLDLVVLFNATPDTVLERNITHQLKSEPFEFTDIQQSLISFENQCPHLRSLFKKYKTLQVVNANKTLDEVFEDVYAMVVAQQAKARRNEILRKNHFRTESQQNLSTAFTRSVSRMGVAFEEMPSDLITKKRYTKSTPKLKDTPHRRPSSASNIEPANTATSTSYHQRSSHDYTFTQSPKDEAIPMDPILMRQQLNMNPKGKDWIFHKRPIITSIRASLAKRWPEAENMYVVSFCEAFRYLRGERDAVWHYFHNRKIELTKYLNRPDCKQEFINHWQKSYNGLTTEQRQQDYMKAELHQQVDDLCHKLWDICDGRKNDSEKEKQSIIEDQWLQDHVALITNYYLVLMQAELTKFQDVVMLFKDYYGAMLSNVPGALPDFTERLPLIKIPIVLPRLLIKESLASKEGEEEGEGEGGEGQVDEKKEEEKKEEMNEEIEQTEEEKCIPLLNRDSFIQTKTSEETLGGPSSADDKGKKGGDKASDPIGISSSQEEASLEVPIDTQLVLYGFNTAMKLSQKLYDDEAGPLEGSLREAEEIIRAPARDTSAAVSTGGANEETPPTGNKGGKDDKGKGKKGAKSPAAGAKKGKTTPTGKGKKGSQPEPEKQDATPTKKPALTPPSIDTAKLTDALLLKEHIAALQHEMALLHARLKLLKENAINFIDKLKDQVNGLYSVMQEWIDANYQQEMESINQLAEVLRCAIEQETKLLYELTLPGIEFKINQGIHMYDLTPPSSPLPPQERTHAIHFTTHQLLSLIGHLRLLISTHVTTRHSLSVILESLSNKTNGMNVFPVSWKCLSHEQIHQLLEVTYGKTVDSFDWRKLVLCLSQPYPLPNSSELLTALSNIRELVGDKKMMTREEYTSVNLWLDERADEVRQKNMKLVFFELFKDVPTDTLDYMNMLLYLSALPNHSDGLLNALSLTTGQLITASSDDSVITTEDLQKVLSHGVQVDYVLTTIKDICTSISEKTFSFNSLQEEDTEINDLINTCSTQLHVHHLPDVAALVLLPRPSSGELHPSTGEV